MKKGRGTNAQDFKDETAQRRLKKDFACSREGLTIRGTEYRPTGNRLPAAIVSHGFSKKYELLALETLDGFLGD